MELQGICCASKGRNKSSMFGAENPVLIASCNQGKFSVVYELRRIDGDGCLAPLEIDRLQQFQDILVTPRP
jgi:hypothetical protein